MRKLASIIAAVAALVVAGVVLLVSRIDSESVGHEVVRQANAIDGVELSVSDFDLGIFSGLRLGKTKAALDMPSGRVDAELESLTFEHELMPLLRGQVSVKQIRLDGPVLALVSREGAAAGSDAAEQEVVERWVCVAPELVPERRRVLERDHGEVDPLVRVHPEGVEPDESQDAAGREDDQQGDPGLGVQQVTSAKR